LNPTFVIRPARASDSAFLFSSFLDSYRESDETNGIPNRIFYEVFKLEFAAILSSFDVLVAHPEGDDDEIAGWLAKSGRVVGWIYVKKTPWRHCGVARQLWNAANMGIEASAIYGASWALKLAKLKGLRISMLPHGKVVRMLTEARHE